ncbi:penicillin-binding protein PBP2B [Streptococcus iniae]|nr:penicillin-binding protein PBP2B [Streptococcus iniae]
MEGIVISFNHENRKQNKKNPSIHLRIHLLFLIIVLLFTSLIFRLAYMQIRNKSFYDAKLKATTVYKVKSSKPRGLIFDHSGKVIVANDIKDVVSFTRNPKVSAKDIKTLAKRLSDYVTFSDNKVSQRAKKDYYLADPEVYAKVVTKLPKKKKFDSYGNRLTEAKVYQNAIDSIKESDLTYSPQEVKRIAIFNQMNATAAFHTVTLKTKALSDQEIAYVIANQSKSPGISVSTDWNRKIEETSLASIIGKVSSREAGLPQEEAHAYLKKGYSLDDRVGTSYLEKSYENELQGRHETRDIKTDKNGKIISDKITDKGENGKNLKLTISSDFQKDVNAIVKNHYQTEISQGLANYSEGIYALAMNPKTGAILAMSGLSRDTESGALQDNALGTFTNVFTPGSVVKGATLAAGWQSSVISGNQVLIDQPIQFGNSKPINSWFTSGQQAISAIQALEYSSNTYMVQVALKMMGQDYHVGMSLTTDGMKSAMERLRSTYAEFGLGTATGIDLSGESQGFITNDYTVSNVVTESFGQFDNYTTLQLAQYVSTIANKGNRMAPHLVEGIYDADDKKGLGRLNHLIEPKALNKVSISDEQLSIIQDGFYQVVNSASPYATGKGLAGSATPISAKTGTAETYAKDSNGRTVETFNLNVVAYGPSSDPQVAVAVMYPHASDPLAKTHQYIAKDIINLYMTKYANQ